MITDTERKEYTAVLTAHGWVDQGEDTQQISENVVGEPTILFTHPDYDPEYIALNTLVSTEKYRNDLRYEDWGYHSEMSSDILGWNDEFGSGVTSLNEFLTELEARHLAEAEDENAG